MQAAVTVIATLLVVALVTNLVLPSRNTSGVVNSYFTGLANAVSAAIGK